ncbi:MAG: DUF4364 family protein [Oscillospiraceae bacterium]|nr:DUF4364 family protein [Oscillospiraceae bacterium]
MERHGFIHDMMDVKVLILFVTARSNYPLSVQEIYELCYQDDCLSYFDVCTAIPEMVTSGHLEKLENEQYQITEKGREAGSITEDSVAFTVRQRAEAAVERYNRKLRRSDYIKTQIVPRENEEYSVIMSLSDEVSNLMTLELVAPNRRQAIHLSKVFEERAEFVYKLVMQGLLDEEYLAE